LENQICFAINHLQHVGIPVTNINASVDFYKRLGFKNVMQSAFTSEGETGTCIIMENNSVIIELYQLPEQQLEEVRKRRNGHIDHIALDVDDIDIAFSELKNASFHIDEEQPVFLPFWKNGCKYFNIIGPDGERLEFNQVLK
jgi:catechol 2,3-dioxygenase-like lactoylglutathione lyase family enzyme